MDTRANLDQMAISRRDALRAGVCGAAGVAMAGSALLAAAPAAAPKAVAKPGKAKALIQVWMWGGPCHLDTFDPKPEAGADYTGPLDKPIESKVKGVRICELLPMMGAIADKYAIIRSMTHGNNGHETAAYMVQTGRKSGDGLVWPTVGAVVSLFKGYDAGYKGLVPPYIVLTELQGRFSEVGFLPTKCKPFATGGDPGQNRFAVEGIVAEGITQERQEARRGLLEKLGTFDRAMKDDPRIAASLEAQKAAYDMILGDGAKIFDLTQEKDEMRERYGRNTFGQACLMARRLVERGVPYITINSKGWDTHKAHFPAMRNRLPQVDRGMASLIEDLSSLGLLDSTIVWWGGEFGRTPKVQWEAPWNGGRGHFGAVFNTVVAGGGFKGGHVVGASDARGETVKDRPVYPWDLIGSMYELLGIDPQAQLPHPQGKIVKATPTAADGVTIGGRLSEIM